MSSFCDNQSHGDICNLHPSHPNALNSNVNSKYSQAAADAAVQHPSAHYQQHTPDFYLSPPVRRETYLDEHRHHNHHHQVVHSLQQIFEVDPSNQDNNNAVTLNHDHRMHGHHVRRPQPIQSIEPADINYNNNRSKSNRSVDHPEHSIYNNAAGSHRAYSSHQNRHIQSSQPHTLLLCPTVPNSSSDNCAARLFEDGTADKKHIRHNRPISTTQSAISETTSSAPDLMDPWCNADVEQYPEDMLHNSSSNGREARNRAEKNRRDKIGGFVQNLSTLIPYVSESPRRVDKTGILRLAVHGLRINHVFGKSTEPSPRNLSDNLSDAFLRFLDTFLLVVTIRGQITLISSEVETHLGHCQSDLYGRNILSITHPDDHEFLRHQLIPNNLDRLFDIQPHGKNNGEPRIRTADEEKMIDQKLREDKRKFTFRIARAGPRTEPTTYEMVRLDGCFRRADLAPRGLKESTVPSGLQLIRRTRGKDDSIPLHTISSNDIVLVAMVHVIKPPSICDRLFEAVKFEYMTRHLIDGRIVQCDQRISVVAGYMADEVCGLSPFSFMHKSDVRWVMVALRQMYDCSYKFGESCYRLIARNGEFIYLRTHGFLDINDENQVGSFVCRNTQVSEEEGRSLIQKMKNRFVIMIREDKNVLMIDTDMPVEGPVQLERAIMRLIMKLPHSSASSSCELSVGSPIESLSVEDLDPYGHNLQSPLAYITPTIDTIRVSIDKSVRIIEISTSRNSENDDDEPAGGSSAGRTSSYIDNARTSSVKEQLVIFQTPSQRKTEIGASANDGFGIRDYSEKQELIGRTEQVTRCLHQEPPTFAADSINTIMRPDFESPKTNSGRPTSISPYRTSLQFINTSFAGNEPGSRHPSPINNKPRDFCSSVGGFSFDGHAILQRDSQRFSQDNNQSTVRKRNQLKRTHSIDDFECTSFDELPSPDEGTCQHSSNPHELYSTNNNKVFVTARSSPSITNTSEFNLTQRSPGTKKSLYQIDEEQDTRQYEENECVEDMSECRTSSVQGRPSSSFGCAEHSFQQIDPDTGDVYQANEAFQMMAGAFIKTEDLLEQHQTKVEKRV